MRAWNLREILTYLERVEPALARLDYYELLDVPANATDHQIQDAFHNIAGGIHPDRLRKQLTPEQKERLTIVYARIAEAYRVLRDPAARKKYLQEKARERGTAGPRSQGSRSGGGDALATLSPKAQRLYRRAQAALRTGDRASAVLNLRMALAQHPQSGLLKAALKQAKG